MNDSWQYYTVIVALVTSGFAIVTTIVTLTLYLRNKEKKDNDQDAILSKIKEVNELNYKDLDKRFSDWVMKDKDHESQQSILINNLSNTMCGLDRTMSKIEKSLESINGNMNKIIIASEKIKDFDNRLKALEQKNNVQRQV